MKTLLIDAGNSSIKWALSSTTSSSLTKQQRVYYANKPAVECLGAVLKQVLSDCDSLVIVSVLGDNFIKQAENLATRSSISFKNISSQEELAGVRNAYTETHKLGADRFVGMIAAHHLSKSATIVIDVGTATTIDAIDKSGQHLGGLILPGSKLCADSLLKNTAQLSEFNDAEVQAPVLFSKETTQAISSASVFGLAGAIDSICEKMEAEINNNSKQEISRILCGGGAENLLPFMQGDYQHHDDLLMIGLQKLVNE